MSATLCFSTAPGATVSCEITLLAPFVVVPDWCGVARSGAARAAGAALVDRRDVAGGAGDAGPRPCRFRCSVSSSFCTTSGTTLPSYVTESLVTWFRSSWAFTRASALSGPSVRASIALMSAATWASYACCWASFAVAPNVPPAPPAPAAGQSSWPRLSVTVTSFGSSPWTLEDTMWAMPRDGRTRRACRCRSGAPTRVPPTPGPGRACPGAARAAPARAVTPSMPSICEAMSPSRPRWNATRCWKSVAPRPEARHVGEAGVVARARRPSTPARPAPSTAGSRARRPRCRRSRPCR